MHVRNDRELIIRFKHTQSSAQGPSSILDGVTRHRSRTIDHIDDASLKGGSNFGTRWRDRQHKGAARILTGRFAWRLNIDRGNDGFTPNVVRYNKVGIGPLF